MIEPNLCSGNVSAIIELQPVIPMDACLPCGDTWVDVLIEAFDRLEAFID